jgi:hypothetical protein
MVPIPYPTSIQNECSYGTVSVELVVTIMFIHNGTLSSKTIGVQVFILWRFSLMENSFLKNEEANAADAHTSTNGNG